MNLIAALAMLALLSATLVVAVPVLTFAAVLAIAAGCFFLWLLPILIIANSDKTTGGEKLCWILAILFLSWFAWILYFFLAPIKQKPQQRYHYY
ncbi:MAG: hypothetical protein RLZZ227_230 [Pseudomonadota bacterium]|jgi:hypothetical protein